MTKKQSTAARRARAQHNEAGTKYTEALRAMNHVNSPTLASAAARLTAEHRAHARGHAAVIQAELDLIDTAAHQFTAGQLNWHDLLNAYDFLRDAARESGITGFSTRWLARIRYDRRQLVRLCGTISARQDGVWCGSTGFAGLTRGPDTPARGVTVVFVLFGADGVPVRYGHTHHLYQRLKTLHRREGLRWSSWRAEPCAQGQRISDARRDLEARYGAPITARRWSRGSNLT